MKKRTILQKMEQLDTLLLPEKEQILANCASAVPESAFREVPAKEKRRRFRPKAAMALAMAALLLVGSGVTVAAAEAMEFKRAEDFFEEYNLSAEGLSRSEIKKVYRDISTERFTYEKTAEVLIGGLEGYEIQSGPLTADDLKRLWLVGYTMHSADQQQTGEAGVEYLLEHLMIENNGDVIAYKDEVVKKLNGEKLWTVRLDDFYAQTCRPVGDQVLVAGLADFNGNFSGISKIRIYLFNADSSIAWQMDYDSNRSDIRAQYILYTDDAFALFAVSNGELWIAKIGMDGKLQSQERMAFDSTGEPIERVVATQDRYLLLKGTNLMQIKDGAVQSSVRYGNEKERYVITDMVEYNGLIYLSGTMMSADGHDQTGLYEKYQAQFGDAGATPDECLEFFRENHTAVLLICDPTSGEPREFYTVPGASGATLTVGTDKLYWIAHRYTHAQEVGGSLHAAYITTGCFAELEAEAWRYVFSPYGQLIAEGDTGRSVELEG